MPARTRIAAVTLLAAAGAAFLPVTGAEAADHGQRDRTGGDRAVVRDGGSREAAADPAVVRREATGHPAAGTGDRRANHRERELRVTHREHSGVSRPAPLRPAEQIRRANGTGRVGQAGEIGQVGQVGEVGKAGQGALVLEGKRVKQAKQARPVKQARKAKQVRQAKRHVAASNPVRRMVQAGQTVKGRHDVGTPLVAGGALLAVGGGAYGVRLLSRRRAARPEA
ncbi:hypothetical protein [Streptomyces sp. I05A-00742]|uniref:hypothetical protein n=1 Tax=Streptomyces sp. I05A-00742 TaxID=2732853 RepID=UPI0014878055|nr:hypothetical protein [Streptomyces sp. I05A-00742]